MMETLVVNQLQEFVNSSISDLYHNQKSTYNSLDQTKVCDLAKLGAQPAILGTLKIPREYQ